jgi:hypothetical protein
MARPEEFLDWFISNAQHLPLSVKNQVIEATHAPDIRGMFVALQKLNDTGQLPPEWEPKLAEFYSRFF